MNLQSLRLKEAFNLTLRTMPILLVRLGVYVVFWLVAMIYLGIAGGLAFLVGKAVPFLGVILFLVALGGTVPLYSLAKKYVLYLVKAAHVAVVAELLSRGELPAGANQLQWGKDRVQERFGEASIMFVVDELVEGVIRAFTGAVYSIAAFLPIDALRSLANMINRVIRFALSYVDEAILARTFWRKEGSVWANARDGVVLYGMVWKPLLLNAVALMLLSYIPFLLVMLLFSAPISALLSAISPTVAGWSIIATLLLAYLVKVAVGDAFAMTAMVASYQREIEGLQPDAQVTAKLEQVSDKFRELQRRAQEELSHFGRKAEPQPAEIPPAAS
ncbi:MAG: hypothetical protein GXY76_10220 [Chloroflexi bacterium]|nr:hypothetical protein [Chloroflexota bacterium]